MENVRLPANGARSQPERASSRAPRFHASGFWSRFASAIIDSFIVVPVALALAWIVGKIVGFGLPPSLGFDYWLDLLLGNDPSMVTLLVIVVATATVYLFVFQATLGRTLGMRVLRMRVVDIYGDAPTAPRAALRTGGWLVSLLTFGLGFLWIGFDSEKRGLHDWIASTYVVKA